MIEAELPDGTVLEFPDGTPDDVIDRAVRQQLGAAETGDISQPQQPGGEAGFRQAFGIEPSGVSAETLASRTSPLGTAAAAGVTEPLAGLAGLGVLSSPLVQGARAFGADPGALAAQTVEAVRGLTPAPTPEGQQALGQAIQQIPEPLREMGAELSRDFEAFADRAGAQSPIAGAIVKTGPVLAAQAAGLGFAKALTRRSGAPGVRRTRRALAEAAPSVDELKEAARSLYNDLDGSGVGVRPQALNSLNNRIFTALGEEGVGIAPGNFPRTTRAMSALRNAAQQGQELSLKQLDQIRRAARAAEQSIDPPDSRLGGMMVREIDEFLDNATPAQLTGPRTRQIGETFRTARQLWGRARRSEMIAVAFDKAQRAPAGFDSAIRSQFRQILDNPRKARFFNRDEVATLERVARPPGGLGPENMLRVLSKMGIQDGRVFGPAMGSLAVGLGFGSAGAAALVPAIGTVSQSLARRLLANRAQFADTIIRAGSDGEAIVRGYFRHVRPSRRSAQELGQLLMQPRVNIEGIFAADSLSRRAIQAAVRNRAAIAAGAAAASAQTPSLQQPQPAAQ